MSMNQMVPRRLKYKRNFEGQNTRKSAVDLHFFIMQTHILKVPYLGGEVSYLQIYALVVILKDKMRFDLLFEKNVKKCLFEPFV